MAVFYVGPRPVLKGRNANNDIHPWKGKVAVYSNWSIFNKDHVLDGAPNTDHTIGTGYSPHGLKLSRLYRGLENAEQPIKNAGGGTRLTGFRTNPWTHKGLAGNKVLTSSFGHIVRENDYNIFIWSNDHKIVPLKDATLGHVSRSIGATGTANSFGAFNPWVFKGLVKAIPITFGQAVPAGNQTSYGHNRILEWTGVLGAKAIKI